MNDLINTYNSIPAADVSGKLETSLELMRQFKVDFLNEPVIVGASGAIFGLLLAFGMTFPNSMIYMYFLFPIKAKWFVILYGAIELFSGISNADNVAHYAHLGGMLFGFVLIQIWKKRRNNF
jgi:membrane associated rhomboid family serine protease